MIEIVFGESACGSLKIAQTYGKGKYRGSAVSVFMRHEDGSVPSSDEMKEAQIQAQEQEHIAWENAIPLVKAAPSAASFRAISLIHSSSRPAIAFAIEGIVPFSFSAIIIIVISSCYPAPYFL